MRKQVYFKIPIYNPKVWNKELNTYEKNPNPRPDLTEHYNNGLLRKEQLKHGKYYLGNCRNAEVARWNENTQLFYYVRRKFGYHFEEEIPHPADDEGFDIFTPVEEIEPLENEKVKEGFED